MGMVSTCKQVIRHKVKPFRTRVVHSPKCLLLELNLLVMNVAKTVLNSTACDSDSKISQSLCQSDTLLLTNKGTSHRKPFSYSDWVPLPQNATTNEVWNGQCKSLLLTLINLVNSERKNFQTCLTQAIHCNLALIKCFVLFFTKQWSLKQSSISSDLITYLE